MSILKHWIICQDNNAIPGICKQLIIADKSSHPIIASNAEIEDADQLGIGIAFGIDGGFVPGIEGDKERGFVFVIFN